jgi:hypothetical protein
MASVFQQQLSINAEQTKQQIPCSSHLPQCHAQINARHMLLSCTALLHGGQLHLAFFSSRASSDKYSSPQQQPALKMPYLGQHTSTHQDLVVVLAH